MDTQENVSRGTGAFQAIWEGQNGNKLREIFAERFEFHNLDGRNDRTGLQGLRERVAALHAAHPAAQLRLEDAIISGSHVAFGWTVVDPLPESRIRRDRHTAPFNCTGSLLVRLGEGHVEDMWELNGALPA
jgi:hypothetical protein